MKIFKIIYFYNLNFLIVAFFIFNIVQGLIKLLIKNRSLIFKLYILLLILIYLICILLLRMNLIFKHNL